MDGRKPSTLRAERGLTIEEIAALTHAKPRPGDPLDRRIANVAPLDTATASDVSFLDNSKYAEAIATTRAGACFVSPKFETLVPQAIVALVTEQPYRAFVVVARGLFPDALRPTSLFGERGRSAAAQVHPSARLEAGVIVDPLAVVGPQAEIGSRYADRRRRRDRSRACASAAIARSAPARPFCMR
jgi:UDP-3-O-[3-hydroxymyristoyl] glucosamine N-acyltransferase